MRMHRSTNIHNSPSMPRSRGLWGEWWIGRANKSAAPVLGVYSTQREWTFRPENHLPHAPDPRICRRSSLLWVVYLGVFSLCHEVHTAIWSSVEIVSATAVLELSLGNEFQSWKNITIEETLRRIQICGFSYDNISSIGFRCGEKQYTLFLCIEHVSHSRIRAQKLVNIAQ